jgi:hypothetical protein
MKYDIDNIIREALRTGVDISPVDRREWAMFCCALKILGYDENTFVALSSGSEADSRRTWRAERNPSRYKNDDTARGMIVKLAKSAGIDVSRFSLSPDYTPKATTKLTIPPRPIQPRREVCYVTPQQVEAAQAHAHETGLYDYLCREYERTEVDRVVKAYRLGGSKFADKHTGGRAISFPYINRAGKCVDCHLMKYDPTTGSSKQSNGSRLPNSWAIAELSETECASCKPNENRQQHKNCPNRESCPRLPRRAEWCNFGDHLLTERPTAPIGIVESEKSAVIMSLTYPEQIWIAVQGKQNLNAKRFEAYRGRAVTIYPDRDGYCDKVRHDGRGVEIGWRTIATELARQGFNISVDTTTENYYPQFIGTDAQGHSVECKRDIADLVIEYRHNHATGITEAQRIFNNLCNRYPLLVQFAHDFKLSVVG